VEGGVTTYLLTEAKQRGIAPPLERTVSRYGITVDEWLALLHNQGWCCPICRKHRGVKWTTDHEHVRGWSKMPPEQRRRYVRGVLCRHCNWKVVHSRLSAEQARRIAAYLEAYEARRDA
jgi:hypothetical protein